jgi:hypothetical protein
VGDSFSGRSAITSSDAASLRPPSSLSETDKQTRALRLVARVSTVPAVWCAAQPRRCFAFGRRLSGLPVVLHVLEPSRSPLITRCTFLNLFSRDVLGLTLWIADLGGRTGSEIAATRACVECRTHLNHAVSHRTTTRDANEDVLILSF